MAPNPPTASGLFASREHAELYDRSIHWGKRLAREIPTLIDVFGPPGSGRILDAGCGPGRQACALAEAGYRVVGADSSEPALELARQRAAGLGDRAEFVCARYAELSGRLGSGFDGVYCVGNSLAAAGTQADAREAVRQFGRCLRPGGRLFVQILNFAPMREEMPCVRGPRVVTVDGMEYVSTRQFHFMADHVQVSNVTLWNDGAWRCRAHAGRLYPISEDELREWCVEADLFVDELRGGYDGAPFDAAQSVDLIVVATRK